MWETERAKRPLMSIYAKDSAYKLLPDSCGAKFRELSLPLAFADQQPRHLGTKEGFPY